MSVLLSIFMVQAFASSLSGTDITVCRHKLPFNIERKIVTSENKSLEICIVHLDKTNNIYDAKKKIDVVIGYSYRLPDCNLDTNLNSFRLITKTKMQSYAIVHVSTTLTKVSKKFCDEYPPNSIIINHPKR